MQALLQLGVSECEGDEGVAVLLDTLGILRAFPYLCLNVRLPAVPPS